MNEEDKPVFIVACGHSWGIGTYRVPEEFRQEFGEFGYGIGVRPENPHDFWPDVEACSQEELAAHAEACRAWDAEHGDKP